LAIASLESSQKGLRTSTGVWNFTVTLHGNCEIWAELPPQTEFQPANPSKTQKKTPKHKFGPHKNEPHVIPPGLQASYYADGGATFANFSVERVFDYTATGLFCSQFPDL